MRIIGHPLPLRAAVALLAVASFGLTACGGGDGGGADDKTSTSDGPATSGAATTGDTGDTGDTGPTGTAGTTGTTIASTAAQPPADPADVALAESMVLTVEDLPAGWKAEPSSGDGDTFDEAKMRRRCPAAAGMFDDLRDVQGREMGKADASFVLGDRGLPGIQSSVFVTVDAEAADRGYAVYTSDELLACMTSVFATKIAADGSTTGEIRTAPLPIRPVGDAAEAVRVTIPISANGSEITVFLDYIVLRVDRVLHMLLVASADLFPLPDGTETQAIAAAVDRAA